MSELILDLKRYVRAGLEEGASRQELGAELEDQGFALERAGLREALAGSDPDLAFVVGWHMLSRGQTTPELVPRLMWAEEASGEELQWEDFNRHHFHTFPGLTAALEHPEGVVRVWAARRFRGAADGNGGLEAAGARGLLALLEESDPTLQHAALDALGGLCLKGVPHGETPRIVAALRFDPTPAIRVRVAELVVETLADDWLFDSIDQGVRVENEWAEHPVDVLLDALIDARDESALEDVIAPFLGKVPLSADQLERTKAKRAKKKR